MDLADLVRAILGGDVLAARQWVSDSERLQLDWSVVERPVAVTERELVVGAALVELLAGRAGYEPPVWTVSVGPLDAPVVLDPRLEGMPRTFERAVYGTPEPLRKRNLIAPSDFLTVR